MQSEEEMENSDMIGVVKIKDGLFICDEFGAQVSHSQLTLAICASSLCLMQVAGFFLID
jgi:hypothetical protein